MSRSRLLTVLKKANNEIAPNLVPEAANLKGWWEAFDPTTLYTDAGTTPVSADGDLVYRMADKSGNNRHFDQATAGARPLYKVNRQNGKSGLLFDGTDDTMTGAVLSTLVANNAKTIFMAVKIPVGWATTDNLIDSATYLMVQTLTGNLIKFSNWDGTYDITAGQSFTDGVALVYTCWHSAGNIYDQKNNGAVPAAVASGNTTNLTGDFVLYKRGTAFLPGDFYGMAIYNVALSDASRSAVNRYFMKQLGL